MFKQSPSRNHRSKRIKAKHVLQICVLLAVCFWLIYQLKHSHDKKKAFDESDTDISLKTHVRDEVLKFGRKDLQPRLEETTMKNEKHDEEEAEEEETGGEEEEDNKHEEEEQEEDKSDEKEDEARGAGDDEIDEHDQEKSEMEAEHEEDFIDDEKEREEGDEKEAEEKDAEDKEGQNENESSLEDHDRDGGSRNAHEAREEHYKADDASSAVTHETEVISTETEQESLEESLEGEIKVNKTEEFTFGQNTTDLRAGEGEMAENGIPPNVTGKEGKGYEFASSKSEDSSVLNSTMRAESNDQPEIGNNSTEGNSETNNLSLQNGTETKPDSTEAQNATVGGGTTSEGSNLQTIALGQENNSYTALNNNQSDINMIYSTTENAEAATGGSSNSSSTSEVKSNESIEVEEGQSGSMTMEDNTDATQNEKSDVSNGTDESSDSYSKTENADEVHHDPIDTSDSSFPLEKDVRTDLDTLPEIITEGSNDEDTAAE